MGELYIGERISLLRKGRGMTQKQLAEKLNVSDKAISRWERGESAPDLSLIPEISDLFGITCDELLRGEFRSPAQSPSAAAPTPRTLQHYTVLSVGLILLGLTAALVCYLGIGYRYGVLGFCLELAFCLGAGICQTIGTLNAAEKTEVKKEAAANTVILALSLLSGSALMMNSSLDIEEICLLGFPLSTCVLLGGLLLKWFVVCRDEKLHTLRSNIAGGTVGILIGTAMFALLVGFASMSEASLYLGLILTPIEILTALCIYRKEKKNSTGA